MVEGLGRSKSKACLLAGLSRAAFYYRHHRKEDPRLRQRIREIAMKRRRFGQDRIYIVLRREGWKVNHKKVSRIYREERLSLRLKRRQKRAAAVRVPLPAPDGPNQTLSMDFIFDRLNSGRKFKTLTIVDDFTRECVAIEVDFGMGGERVTRVLDRIVELRGKPRAIRCDNGPEYTSNALDGWAYRNGVMLDFIDPGKPNQNAYIESFNGRYREECLNDNQFVALVEAQTVIEAWRKDYNEERPHGSLNGLTPAEFAASHTTMLNKLALEKHRFTSV